MLSLTWLRGLLRRRGRRLAATALGVAVAVALLASIGAFLAASKATMTARASSTVAVDWQIEVQPGGSQRAVLDATRRAAGTHAAVPVGYASISGFESTTGATTQTTGPGFVLGLPARYRATFPAAFRDLAGAPRGVLLAQQTAANLQARTGDIVQIARPGLAKVSVRVDGIVDLPQADSLFQKVGAPSGSQPQAPPDNVLLVPLSRWHRMFDPLIASRPDLVTTQVHVRRTHALPPDPAAAFTTADHAARNLEARLAGAGVIGDNLGATLSAARSDALYAQILFLFLGLPGAVLAALVTAAVATSGGARRRREQALLRTRGATTRDLVRLSASEATVVGAGGAAVGLGVAALVGHLAFGRADFGATTASAIAWGAGAVVVGWLIALVAVTVPAWRDARTLTVVSARRSVEGAEGRWWTRYGLDFIALGLGALVFWLAGRSGYELVLAPEGTPSIAVSYWALAGPALAWIGAGLLALRFSDWVLTDARTGLARVLRPFSGALADTIAAAMSRQRRLFARALALVMLTVVFAASTAVFNSTYRQQAEVDARLTNGGDVTVTESPDARVGPKDQARLAGIPGVRTVEPIQHRFAYVGADLQDLYGVRPSTVVDRTQLQDAYFQGGSARDVMSKLARQPDAVLLSLETVKDFQLRPNDRIRLRLQDARTKQYKTISFRFVGIVLEFPTAPTDSFIVANAGYVTRHTGSNAVGEWLIDAGGASPKTVAARVRNVVGPTAKVTDVTSSLRLVGSSLTAVDLSGLTKVELAFALLLAAAAAGLVIALGNVERRRTFAITAALGAKTRAIGGFVWSEAAYVALGGLALGAIGGWVLAEMLVKVLTGVFDPPPASLSVPWIYLGATAAVAIAAVTVASVSAIRSATSSSVAVLREL